MTPKMKTSEVYLYHNGKLLGTTYASFFSKYGILQINNDLENIIQGKKIDSKQRKILNLCDVQGEYCYRLSDFVEPTHEYNPSIRFIDASRSRWVYPEIEHKINIRKKQMMFWDAFDTIEISNFSRGKSVLQHSYEKYISLEYGKDYSKRAYIALLSRNSVEKPNAIKYKVSLPGEILTRQTSILVRTRRFIRLHGLTLSVMHS